MQMSVTLHELIFTSPITLRYHRGQFIGYPPEFWLLNSPFYRAVLVGSMHFFARKMIVIFLIPFVFSACALAPGQKMNAKKISNDGSFESDQIELIEITPAVIQELRTHKKHASIPDELLRIQAADYRIGSSDVLFITVWNHPELTVPGTQFNGSDTNGRIVKPDGNLFYPYIGNIQAAGKTTEELRTEISKKLAIYIESPQVDVGVLHYYSQRVTLSGAFVRSQAVPITNKPLSLLEALGIGQVNPELADLSSLRLTREGKTYVLDIYALTREPSSVYQIYLQDDDSIHLPFNDENKVFIMGEINKPQALAMKSSSINLTDAIGTAGGMQQLSAKGQDVYIIRGVDDLKNEKAKIFQLKARSPSAFILANNFPLQAQDVVFVGASGVTRWNRVISQIIPTLSILGLTSRAWRDIDDISGR